MKPSKTVVLTWAAAALGVIVVMLWITGVWVGGELGVKLGITGFILVLPFIALAVWASTTDGD